MWKKTYRSASGFNWEREAHKRIACQSTSLHHLTPSLFRSLEDEVLERIGQEEGIDGYLLRVEVEDVDLKKAREVAAKNPSPYIVLHIVGEYGEEYRGREGEELKIQDPADYIVEQNIYFNYPAIPELNQPIPPKKEVLYGAISSLISPSSEKTSPFLENILGSYRDDSWDIDGLQEIFPGLLWMIRRIGDSRQGLEFLPFMKSFLRIPYGLPLHTIHLFFAFTIDYYGQRLWCRPDPKALGESIISNTDFFYQLVQGHYPRAIIYLRDLTSQEKKYSFLIYDLFSAEKKDLSSSYESLHQWWHQQLAPVSRQMVFYDDEVAQLVKRLKHLSFLSYSLFLNKDLPEIFPQVEEGLKRAKEEIEKTPGKIEKSLLKSIEEVFSQGMGSWYESLHPHQKNLDSSWHDTYTRSLLGAIEFSKNERVVFLSQILHLFKIGPIFEWERDEREKVLQLLKRSKKRVDQYRTSIPMPVYHVSGEKGEGDTYYFKRSFTLDISPPVEGTTLYVTYNGEDPRKETAKRERIQSAYQYQGDEDTFIALVSRRDEDYGEPVYLELKDSLKKYTIQIEEDLFTEAGAREPEARFTLPTTKSGIERTLYSLFVQWLEKGVSRTTLENSTLHVLDSLKKE